MVPCWVYKDHKSCIILRSIAARPTQTPSSTSCLESPLLLLSDSAYLHSDDWLLYLGHRGHGYVLYIHKDGSRLYNDSAGEGHYDFLHPEWNRLLQESVDNINSDNPSFLLQATSQTAS